MKETTNILRPGEIERASLAIISRELEQRGTPEAYEEVLRAIRERDWNDTHRSAAPLRQAEDAVVLDTTHLDFAQSLEALKGLIRERTGG